MRGGREREGLEFTGEAGGELGDEGSGDGESGDERPGAVPLPLEEDAPWIEPPHFLSPLSSFSLSLPPRDDEDDGWGLSTSGDELFL